MLRVCPSCFLYGLPLLLLRHCRSGEDKIKGPDEEREEEFATGPLSLLMQVRTPSMSGFPRWPRPRSSNVSSVIHFPTSSNVKESPLLKCAQHGSSVPRGGRIKLTFQFPECGLLIPVERPALVVVKKQNIIGCLESCPPSRGRRKHTPVTLPHFRHEFWQNPRMLAIPFTISCIR